MKGWIQTVKEDKKIEIQDFEVKDEALDQVAGGGSPEPTATPTPEKKKPKAMPYGKRFG